jgi:hypothetical protein
MFTVVLRRRIGIALASLGFVSFPLVTAAASPCPYQWMSGLNVGSLGEGVMKLQQFLNSDPLTRIASVGPGSPGQETTRYGALTKIAVSKFQEKYASDILLPNGLSAGTGKFGLSTRTKVNSLCATGIVGVVPHAAVLGASTTTAVASDALAVSIPEQPAATLAPPNALYVPFTKITLTAGSKDIDVRSITVARIGPSKNTVFSALDLFMDEDAGYASTGYLGSANTATFRDPFTIPAGASRTLNVTGEMAADLTDYDGQIASFSVDAIDASSPLAGASLPIRGTFQTINNSLVIGSASAMLSQYDPGAAQTKYVNDTAVRFAGVRITAGSKEDIRLNSIVWDQSGTASPSDIWNVVVVINGTSYPAEVDGRSYSVSIPNGLVIQKGNSADLYIQGDIGTTGSNRTVKFDIRYPTDIDITGMTYGYGIYLVPGGNTATDGTSVFITDTGDSDGVSGTPFFSASPVTVSAGAATFIGR